MGLLNLLTAYQKKHLVEFLPYHECDTQSRQAPDLECLVKLQAQHTQQRHLIFLTGILILITINMRFIRYKQKMTTLYSSVDVLFLHLSDYNCINVMTVVFENVYSLVRAVLCFYREAI